MEREKQGGRVGLGCVVSLTLVSCGVERLVENADLFQWEGCEGETL